MNSLSRILVVAALAGLCVWGWFKLFPGDDRIIRKNLGKLATVASFNANEPPLTRLGNAKELSNFFSSDVQIDLNFLGRGAMTIQGRDQLFELAMAARSSGPGATVELLDPVVDLSGSPDGAVVNLTLKAQVGGQSDLIVQELRLTLTKRSGAWLIRRIEAVKTLR